MIAVRGPALLLVLSLLFGAPAASVAGDRAVPDSSIWKAAALPAISYDADEGFGYGAMGAIYAYGPDDSSSYRFTLQPKLLRTTGGRRDYELFFDAPGRLLPDWHLTAELFRERLLAAPYYGVGNDTPFLPARERSEPHYYQFRRTRMEAALTVQRPVTGRPIRLLVGWRVGHTRYEPHAEASDRANLFVQSVRSGAAGDWLSAPRVGLVWDSRSRRVGPRSGTWSEILLQRSVPTVGSSHAFTRLTLIDRHYWPLASRLVLATRLIARQMWGDPPFHELSRIQTSERPLDGLGGSDTVRGVPKHRFLGEALVVANLVLRFRLATLTVFGREIDVLGTAFADAGRVWADRLVLSGLATDLHAGAGGGLRLRAGRSLVVGGEVAHGAETGAPIYVRFGYLF